MVKVAIKNKRDKLYDDGLNSIKKVEFDIQIGDIESKGWSFIKEINGTKYSDEHIRMEVALAVYDILWYAWNYNYFKTTQDIGNFVDELGYDCKKGLEAVISIKKIAEEVQNQINDEIDEDFLIEMSELYSDGDPELLEKNKEKIFKYIKVKEI